MDGFAGRWAGASRRALTVGALVALLAVSACGGGDDGSGDATATARAGKASDSASLTPVGTGKSDYGRSLFNELCAGCHTLADAGAHGNRFNLDNVPGLEGAQVWNAIQNGEPGMPPWGDRLSKREISALATYVMTVAKRKDGNDGWGKQITRRTMGEAARWLRISQLIERELDAEGRKAEVPSGRVVAPADR